MTVVALREARDSAVFGGKAVQLGAALRANLPVPDGVAVSAAMVEQLVNGDGASNDTFSRRVSALRGPWAVRSSAIGEDSAEASFAGQHSTKLNVNCVKAAQSALAEVWHSGHTEAALAYRRRMNACQSAQVAVVVQSLVAADVAGVLFTCNPVTGSDEIVIESGWGLGESIVQGMVVPDRFLMTPTGQVVERKPGTKNIAIRMAPDGGTCHEAVPDHLSRRLCLGYSDLARLHQLAARCDEVFGKEPHDIEWAIQGGELFLLQRRPVTRSSQRL